MDDVAAYRYVVSGLVQGVNFRYATMRQAERLGVTGSVRNLADGRVEVVAQGAAEALVALEAFLETGPRYAEVAEVDRSPAPVDPLRRDFRVLF